MPVWAEAIGRMQKRMEDTRRRVGSAYPHWADPETGVWTTTADGDWTGGFFRQILRAPLLSLFTGQRMRPVVSKVNRADLEELRDLIDWSPFLDRKSVV